MKLAAIHLLLKDNTSTDQQQRNITPISIPVYEMF